MCHSGARRGPLCFLVSTRRDAVTPSPAKPKPQPVGGGAGGADGPGLGGWKLAGVVPDGRTALGIFKPLMNPGSEGRAPAPSQPGPEPPRQKPEPEPGTGFPAPPALISEEGKKGRWWLPLGLGRSGRAHATPRRGAKPQGASTGRRVAGLYQPDLRVSDRLLRPPHAEALV
ncbi:hypothetical protein P7K49_001994 [Saguinus oedipus]|uniref:Uncharacterized protein n=1 Tax=Saguinus oedipus TaxID=9490 RepID=A0ABQ9WIP9_SAGOE|nr:hypothetical protein P7K49_001994 [Saguinus oedipus]